ncbi:hypothetical protein F2Q70_00033173 [Brassica cretica]|uniref:Uncharacterized protein n=1 Tax=Brassica cretica TaxID=69181 RepID=A0A8S9FCL6_BRACR|nr:hypothetical protein F2Q70_00033173 [Brassica cretica]
MASRPSSLLFSVRRSILTAYRPSSSDRSKPISLSPFLTPPSSSVPMSSHQQPPFTSISDQSTVNAFRNLKFLGKSSFRFRIVGKMSRGF